MVQAARSGVQNIAEGSQASATSKKTELKLTQVARASLEELKLDYEDFLRHRSLEQWGREHPLRQELVDRRCETADDVAAWVAKVAKRKGVGGHSGPAGQTGPRQTNTSSNKSTLSTKTSRTFGKRRIGLAECRLRPAGSAGRPSGARF